jgi:hypothetical protein
MTDKPWEKNVPSKGNSMSPQQISAAKARAKAAGRPYPNLVDNMAAMKEENAEKHSTNKKNANSRFDGSPELVKIYKNDTPGQSESVKNIVKQVIREVLESQCPCGGDCECAKPKKTVGEATYQGKEVPLNKPMTGDVKKSKVYVKNEKGNVVKVNFGDKHLSIKKDNPNRKRSYCARSSGQGSLTDKTSANYWSRRAWEC